MVSVKLKYNNKLIMNVGLVLERAKCGEIDYTLLNILEFESRISRGIH